MANNVLQFMRVLRSTHKGMKHSTFKNSMSLSRFERRYSSALYISGRYANKTYSYLLPYLDFDEKFRNVEKAQRDLTLRGVEVDVTEVKQTWEFYKRLMSQKTDLEKKVAKLSHEVTPLFSKEDRTAEEEELLSKLQMQMKIVKEDLRKMKEVIWDLDEAFVTKLLKFPNDLDDRTPEQSPVVLKRLGALNTLPEKSIKSHVEIGRDLGLLEYRNPMQCYLCNDAALFELGVLDLAGKIFNNDDMIRVAGSDFSRSLVVEGSGLNHENPADAFVISNHNEVEEKSPNQMHLVGGASLISFLAMHTKQLVNPKVFPLRYFAAGRQYTPFPPSSTPMGLFTVCQSSAVHAFILVKDEKSNEYDTQFERLMGTVRKLYDSVCDHYQIVLRPASELRPWEKLRVSFEMWSPYMKQYIEVGHISVCGHYFCKRLLIAYQTSTGRDYPSVISGTVLSVPRLLGCLLEQDPEKFVIPSSIAEHIPIDHVTP